MIKRRLNLQDQVLGQDVLDDATTMLMSIHSTEQYALLRKLYWLLVLEMFESGGLRFEPGGSTCLQAIKYSSSCSS